MVGFSYPADLHGLVRDKWKKRQWSKEIIPDLPGKKTFQEMIDVVYHASFLTEERRRMWFRVVYISEKEAKKTYIAKKAPGESSSSANHGISM